MDCPECGEQDCQPDDNNFYDCPDCKCVFSSEGVEEHGEKYVVTDDDKGYDCQKEGVM